MTGVEPASQRPKRRANPHQLHLDIMVEVEGIEPPVLFENCFTGSCNQPTVTLLPIWSAWPDLNWHDLSPKILSLVRLPLRHRRKFSNYFIMVL